MKHLAVFFLLAPLIYAQCRPGYDPILGVVTCPPPGTATGATPYSCTISAVSSQACTHNLGTGTNVPWVVCNDASGNVLGGATATTSVTDIVATSTNVATITFSGSTTGVCKISSGSMGATGSTGATGATGSSGNPIRTCTVIVGDPGAASTALADDNDSPVACGNTWGADWTITSVTCWANAGSPTVTPILTGGSGTSILTGALTCGTAAWAAGTVQGTAPVVHSFSANGATCSSTPCTADVNITTAGGTAKYVVVRITGSLP